MNPPPGDGLDLPNEPAFCETVLVIPYDDNTNAPKFEIAFPAVTKDISAEGISLILTEPSLGDRYFVVLQGELEKAFIECKLQHSSSLGYGFFQLGLEPGEVVTVSGTELIELEERVRELQDELVSHQAVCCGS